MLSKLSKNVIDFILYVYGKNETGNSSSNALNEQMKEKC